MADYLESFLEGKNVGAYCRAADKYQLEEKMNIVNSFAAKHNIEIDTTYFFRETTDQKDDNEQLRSAAESSDMFQVLLIPSYHSISMHTREYEVIKRLFEKIGVYIIVIEGYDAFE
ncbi:hypothetical protein NSS82_19210 [Paenibacillus sp. FSL H7-0735]|uniref:hypothetical protein n=1 Tax=Paenibacillus sp. FSL H7-0735 TaxID=2954736 RepID=UPI0030F6FB2E